MRRMRCLSPRRAFTLVELLVVVAVIAILLGILLPALSRSREAARSAICLSNLRQAATICRAYANEHDGFGPAIGQPYLELPNWALVVQLETSRGGTTAASLYDPNSVLVCPTTQATLPQAMTRTYAMNATGHAGAAGDAGNFDNPAAPAHIHFDRVRRPSETAMLFDSAISQPPQGNAPPPSRTASVADFRNAAHIPRRLGKVHAAAGATGWFNAAAFDLSVRRYQDPPAHWTDPLP